MVRLFELIRRRSGKAVPQFARALGYERQHWHRLESDLVQGKLPRTFARAVLEAGLSGDEVLELLKGEIGEPGGGRTAPTEGASARRLSSAGLREVGDEPGADGPTTQTLRTGTST